MNLPAKPWLQPPTDLSDPLNHRIWRSTQAMLLLHDIPVDPRLADLLDAKVGYRSASRCRYVPYWRSGDLASIGSPGIYLSAFTDSRENRSVLVLVNSTGQDVSTTRSPAKGLAWCGTRRRANRNSAKALPGRSGFLPVTCACLWPSE
jgi:hypothetical protein